MIDAMSSEDACKSKKKHQIVPIHIRYHKHCKIKIGCVNCSNNERFFKQSVCLKCKPINMW